LYKKAHKRLCFIPVTKNAPAYSLRFASSLLQSDPCRSPKKSKRNRVVGVISIGITGFPFRRCSLATHNFTNRKRGGGRENVKRYWLRLGILLVCTEHSRVFIFALFFAWLHLITNFSRQWIPLVFFLTGCWKLFNVDHHIDVYFGTPSL
jgi:hypothetical protein